VTRFAFFYQSVISDWNHGNAHFLRGLMRALHARGHSAVCFEQVDNWSLSNLLHINPSAIDTFVARFPDLSYERYALDATLDAWLRLRLAEVDVCIVHEWNEPAVIHRLGQLCAKLGKSAYFHDTHYRVVLDDAYRAQLDVHVDHRPYRREGEPHERIALPRVVKSLGRMRSALRRRPQLLAVERLDDRRAQHPVV
jgi:spore maturation protein CgeB